MSYATEQHVLSGPSACAARIDALLDRFSALLKHVQTLAFPSLRKGVTAPPDMTGWSKLRRIAFTISSPLPTTFTPGAFWPPVVSMVWVTVSLYWIHSAVALLNHIFDISPPTTSQPEQAILLEIIVWVILTIMAALILAAYWRWLEFFRDQRYSAVWRVILAIVFMLCNFGFLWWLDQEYSAQFSVHLWHDRADLRSFVITYVCLVIPAATFYYMFAIGTIVWGARLLWAIPKYLRSAHDPFPRELIRKIALEPIPMGNGSDEPWKLVSLRTEDLELLRGWAAANREATDKRLLPTAILFGVLAIFANTQTFVGFVDKALTWLWGSIRITELTAHTGSMPFAAGQYLVSIYILVFVLFFVQLLLELFRNLVTQSLIIEACIIVRHASEQSRSADSVNEMAENRGGFWERLLGLLWKR